MTSSLPRTSRLRGLHFAVPGVFFTWRTLRFRTSHYRNGFVILP